MLWPKDRKKAFLVAAEMFGTPYNRRTEEQKGLTSHGICHTIRDLTNSVLIFDWASNFRFGIIENASWWPYRRWLWPCSNKAWTPSCDKQRSLFCYLMAALSDKEFEELGE